MSATGLGSSAPEEQIPVQSTYLRHGSFLESSARACCYQVHLGCLEAL
jgi:hypothetical protein